MNRIVKSGLGMFLVSLLFSPGLFAQNVMITQMDSGDLLLLSTLDAYLSLSEPDGEILETADPSLIRVEHETARGMVPVEITEIRRNDEGDGSTTYLLVLDNSGSMYEPVGDGSGGTRMEHAVRAVKAFLSDLDDPKARVGLAVFNTRFTLLAEPSADFSLAGEALKEIVRPEGEEAYTELYYAAVRAAQAAARYRGRKAVILLSDGENFPYFVKTGNPGPETGETVYTPADSLDSLGREGVTLYGVSFSSEKDQSLDDIAVSSGGTIFEARTDEELSGIYRRIRYRIEKEYRVSFRAPIGFLDTPEVKAFYGEASDTGIYNSRPLMGKPGDLSLFLPLVILAASLLLWLLLILVRWEKPAARAEISMLPLGGGSPVQRTVALTGQRTVIGGSPQADFTVVDNPSLRESHATILQDEKTGIFTLISDQEIRVNNNLTRKRNLKPGDVINVEGATIVFDAPEEQ